MPLPVPSPSPSPSPSVPPPQLHCFFFDIKFSLVLSGGSPQACVSPVLDLTEALAAPLFRERGLVVGEGATTQILPPFPSAASALTGPCPRLGEHTDVVLAAVGRRPPA